jgi:ferredoxin
LACRAQEYTVEIEKGDETYKLTVDEDSYILEAAIDAGLDLPHDCKLGVCMTCPAKLISGEVDQSEGMLSDDVQEKGFTLMCIARPLSDCKILCIEEEELLGQMMHSGEL